MRDVNEVRRPVLQVALPYPGLAAVLLGIALAFASTALLQPARVGDGGEYYAMFFAWKDTLRPYMTEVSWREVGALWSSGEVADFTPIEMLREAFPALRLGATADFNHFWFYSALAAAASALASVIHIPLSAHAAFIVTHWLLLSLAIIVAYRYFQYQGVIAAIALAVLSPVVWYVDKAHTEFFTFCLTLSAVIAFWGRNYLLSTLFLSIASTQNISFAAVAAVPFAIHFFGSGRDRHAVPHLTEAGYAALVCLFVLLHPFYYFSRYSVITPQLLAGGADPGKNLRYFYIWILDPDVGLLPNWPLGLAVLFISALIYGREKASREKLYTVLFVTAYLVISLYAQSSSQTLNSGATPGVSRYALWYIPLFFPLLIKILEAAKSTTWIKVAVCLFGLVALLYTLKFQRPQMAEYYWTPSPLSGYLQRHASALYDPPPQIFSERYNRFAKLDNLNQGLAIIAPDCRKMLVIPDLNRDRVFGAQCPFSEEKVKDVVARRLGTMPPQTAPLYMRLTDQETAAVMLSCPRRLDFSVERGFPSIAIKGFSRAEHHGRWTLGRTASFRCTLGADQSGTASKVRITAKAFAFRGHPQHVSVSINGEKPHEVDYLANDETKVLALGLPADQTGPIHLVFRLPDAVAPSELGLNDDKRKIAISVKSVEFE
jgi:hypothetical protein